MLSRVRSLDGKYFQDVLEAWRAGVPSAVVLSDTGVYWDSPGVLGPGQDLGITGLERKVGSIARPHRIDGVDSTLLTLPEFTTEC